MGYFNQHYNWYEFAQYAGIERICTACGERFTPRSPNQKKHSYADWQEDFVDCWLHGELDRMSASQYLNHVGETKKSYIYKYGQEKYNLIVLQKN